MKQKLMLEDKVLTEDWLKIYSITAKSLTIIWLSCNIKWTLPGYNILNTFILFINT